MIRFALLILPAILPGCFIGGSDDGSGTSGSSNGIPDASYQAGKAGPSNGRNVNYCRTPGIILVKSATNPTPGYSGSHDFGTFRAGEYPEATLTLHNYGNWQVNDIHPVSVPGFIEFKGGSYPGQGGNCGSHLMENTGCRVVIRFTGNTVENYNKPLEFSYFTGRVTTKATAFIRARVIPEVDPLPPPSPYVYGGESCESTPIADLNPDNEYTRLKTISLTQRLAQSIRFNHDTLLSKISVRAKTAEVNSDLEHLFVEIYEDEGGVPGESPVAISVTNGFHVQAVMSTVSIIFESAVELRAANTYWIVMRTNGPGVSVSVAESNPYSDGEAQNTYDEAETWRLFSQWDVDLVLHACE